MRRGLFPIHRITSPRLLTAVFLCQPKHGVRSQHGILNTIQHLTKGCRASSTQAPRAPHAAEYRVEPLCPATRSIRIQPAVDGHPVQRRGLCTGQCARFPSILSCIQPDRYAQSALQRFSNKQRDLFALTYSRLRCSNTGQRRFMDGIERGAAAICLIGRRLRRDDRSPFSIVAACYST